jgi:hypothetical protein
MIVPMQLRDTGCVLIYISSLNTVCHPAGAVAVLRSTELSMGGGYANARFCSMYSRNEHSGL